MIKVLPKILLIFSLFILFSCEDDEKNDDITLNFKVIMQNNGQTVQLNELIALDNNIDTRLSMFKLYLSNIHLTNSNGEQTEIAKVKLIDVGSDEHNSFSAKVKVDDYTNLHVGLGLDPVLNASDPTAFPNEHPLSSYQSMYWHMLKYRFVKLEGMANEHGKLGNNDILISLHPGTDPLYKQKNLNINLNLTDASLADLTIIIDINELFAASNPFNFHTEAQTHSGTPDQINISDKFMNELEKSVKLETNIQ